MIQFTKEYENVGVTAPTWQDLHALIETAVCEAPIGAITVKNEISPGSELFADNLIAKVFYNLLDNAARYGGYITTIRFYSVPVGLDTVVVCEDDGEGIPIQDKERIFERGVGKNTGLGLFLAREILGITGITITETGEPGFGARFEILVPEGKFRFNEP